MKRTKLRVKHETLRVLTADQLERVAAGADSGSQSGDKQCPGQAG